MYDIITIGEIIVEIMRDTIGVELSEHGGFKGPYASGAPAIFIDTVGKLKLKTAIIGGVGDDDFGKCILNKLQKDNVDCSYISVEKEYYTGCAFVTYFEDGNRKFIFHIKNSAATEYKNTEDKIFPDTKFFHIMGCSLNSDIKIDNYINNALKYYTKKETIISFDPNVRKEMLQNEKDINKLIDIMKYTDIFLPGVNELLMLTGCDYEEKAVKECFEKYNMRIVVVKDGSRGSRVYTNDTYIDAGVYEIVQKDPTGAGDSFDAGFICSICNGKTLEDAIKVACACGALNAQEFGPMEGKISVDSVNEIIKTKNIIRELRK